MPFLVSRHDPAMVAASIAIATFAAYVALDLAKRMHDADRRTRRHWWLGGSIALGTGIWSTHFVGMLAFSLPLTLGYSTVVTAASWLTAIATSGVALGIAANARLRTRWIVAGSVAMGGGIVAVHFLGMSALEMEPGIVWDLRLVAASVGIAFGVSAIALLIFAWLRHAAERDVPRYQLLAAATLGLAVSGMHYTGMAAASFPTGSFCLTARELGGESLGLLVTLAAGALLGLTRLTSFHDTRSQLRVARIAASLRVANVGLHEERERFKALTALSSDWFWEQDAELRFTAISAGFELGAGAQARWRGKHRWELGAVAIGDEDWRRHRALLARRETFRDLLTQRHDETGRLRTYCLSGAPVFDAAGTFVGYRGVGREITHETERERREALQHCVTRLIAESTSTRHVVREAIRAVCETCGWSGGVLLCAGTGRVAKERFCADPDRPVFDRLRHCDDAAERDRVAAAAGLDWRHACPVSAGSERFGELEFRSRGTRAVDVATLALIDDIGHQVGQFIARRDAEARVRRERERLAGRIAERTLALNQAIRELESAKRAAEEANRAKSAFLATMSHEIRTPMNGVIGMVEVLAESALGEDQADVVRTIRGSAFSLLGLIDDILDFSKIEAGHLALEREPVDLAGLVEGVCDLFGPQAAAKGVALQLFVAPDVPARVWSDPTRLRQTLGNLVGNAVKFSGGRADIAGHVSVRVERVDGRPGDIALVVADNGIGIRPEALPTLFTPFTQAEASTTRRFGGTGLGLVIARRLATLMGGRIDVRSRVGAGATFTVRLPLEAVEDAAPLDGPRLAGLDCLVVDGEHVSAADLRAYLEHAGAQVDVVPDVAAAARRVAALGGDRRAVVIQPVGADLDAQRAARSPFDAGPQVGHVMLVRRHPRAPRCGPDGVVTLREGGLRRDALLQAVAMAAGFERRDAVAMAPADAPAPKPVAPSVAAALADGRLVLVAEDDPVNQQVILRQLALLGYAAELASNGAEALDLWNARRHALLLTDLHMPELDGYALARAIRRAEAAAPGGRRLPILALTANALCDEAAHVREAGMDAYLTKPIRLAELGTALAGWLAPSLAAAEAHGLAAPEPAGRPASAVPIETVT